MYQNFSRITHTDQSLEQRASSIKSPIRAALTQSEYVLVLHHKSCNDGVAAATIVKSHLHQHRESITAITKHEAVAYGDDVVAKVNSLVPEENRRFATLIFVDFCPTPAQMTALTRSFFVIVVDHHASSIVNFTKWYAEQDDVTKNRVIAVMDEANTMSGAMMSWWLFDSIVQRQQVAYVDQYDRFQKGTDWDTAQSIAGYLKAQIGNAGSVNAQISVMYDALRGVSLIEDAEEYGKAYALTIGAMANNAQSQGFTFADGGQVTRGIMFTSDKSTVSDIAEQIRTDNSDIHFVIGMIVRDRTIEYSIRSRDGAPITALEIAEIFGGGGHRHAAGFRTPFNQLSNTVSKICGLVAQIDYVPPVDDQMGTDSESVDCGPCGTGHSTFHQYSPTAVTFVSKKTEEGCGCGDKC